MTGPGTVIGRRDLLETLQGRPDDERGIVQVAVCMRCNGEVKCAGFETNDRGPHASWARRPCFLDLWAVGWKLDYSESALGLRWWCPECAEAHGL